MNLNVVSTSVYISHNPKALNLLWLIAAVAAVALNADDSVWTTIANYETKMTDGEDDDDDDDDANVDDDSHSPPLQLQRPLHDDLRRLLLIDVRGKILVKYGLHFEDAAVRSKLWRCLHCCHHQRCCPHYRRWLTNCRNWSRSRYGFVNAV